MHGMPSLIWFDNLDDRGLGLPVRAGQLKLQVLCCLGGRRQPGQVQAAHQGHGRACLQGLSIVTPLDGGRLHKTQAGSHTGWYHAQRQLRRPVPDVGVRPMSIVDDRVSARQVQHVRLALWPTPDLKAWLAGASVYSAPSVASSDS